MREQFIKTITEMVGELIEFLSTPPANIHKNYDLRQGAHHDLHR